MSNITKISNLSFFSSMCRKTKNEFTTDFRNLPRPYFIMCLDIEGEGVFMPENGDENIYIHPGDIIFIPVSTRYMAIRKGNPNIIHIGIHFLFEYDKIALNQRDYRMQKVTLPNFEETKQKFEFVYSHHNGTETEQYASMGVFYSILSEVLPLLHYKRQKKIDDRIDQTISYIDTHYSEPISIPELADISKMSIPYFFSCFKEAVGMSPIEYKNKVCIDHAMLLLLDTDKRTIEEISEMLGFASSIYFRRVFKKITGQTPKEYQKSSLHQPF